MGVASGIYNSIDQINQQKEAELDSETEQVADNISDRHDQTWKIDFPEDAGIGDECIGSLGHTLCKVIPHTGTSQIEERPRNTIRRDTGDTAEHDEEENFVEHLNQTLEAFHERASEVLMENAVKTQEILLEVMEQAQRANIAAQQPKVEG